MDIILEFINAACSAEGLTPQDAITGTVGLLKLADLGSDIFFVVALDNADNVVAWNYEPIWLAAVLFIFVGICFDLYKVYHWIRQKCAAKDTHETPQVEDEPQVEDSKEVSAWWKKIMVDEDANWKWWKRSNLLFEELPQLVILLVYFNKINNGDCSYGGYCYSEDMTFERSNDINCMDGLCKFPGALGQNQTPDEVRADTRSAAITSTLFTLLSMAPTITAWVLYSRSKDNNANANANAQPSVPEVAHVY